MKAIIISTFIAVASASVGLSQFKAGQGFYIVVNFVPQVCKTKFEGYYEVSEELKISLPFDNVKIAVDRDAELIREDVRAAISRYCSQVIPELLAIPVINIIDDAHVKKAGDGVMVLGRVTRPGLIPMKEGLTVFSATQAAGGVDEFSTIKDVSIIRDGKVIRCDLTKATQFKTLLKSGDLVFVPLKCPISETGY